MRPPKNPPTMTTATTRSRTRPLRSAAASLSSGWVISRAMCLEPMGTTRINPFGRTSKVQDGDRAADGVRDVVDRDPDGAVDVRVEASAPLAELRVRGALVDVAVDDQGRSAPEQDGFEGAAAELRPPFLLLTAHRRVGRRIVREQHARAVGLEETVERRDPPLVLPGEVGEFFPLPPRRPVERARAPDDLDAPAGGCLEGRGLILQEPDGEALREPLPVRRVGVRVLVVPEDGPDRRVDP